MWLQERKLHRLYSLERSLGRSAYNPLDEVCCFQAIGGYLYPLLQKTLKTTCNSDGIHGGVCTWLFYHVMKEPAKAVLSYCMSAIENNEAKKKRTGNSVSSSELPT